MSTEFEYCIFAEPHVASNVRYIAFSLGHTLRATCGTLHFRWATRCEQRAVHCISAEPHVASNVRYIAFSLSSDS